MMILSQKKALKRLKKLKDSFKFEITARFESRAKSCLTCEVQGSCCLDEHFVNVRISKLEAVAIRQFLDSFSETRQAQIYSRIERAIVKYRLTDNRDSDAKTFACPLFEKGIGCLIHEAGKPVPCIAHACYENAADLPPENLQAEQENLIDDLNSQTYRRPQPWLPIPLAIRPLKVQNAEVLGVSNSVTSKLEVTPLLTRGLLHSGTILFADQRAS